MKMKKMMMRRRRSGGGRRRGRREEEQPKEGGGRSNTHTECDDVKIISNHSEQILKPIDFNFPSIKLESIKGGTTIDEAAKIFHDVISGKGSVEQNNVVCANAAVAIQTIDKSNYEDALAKAQESLISGKAFEKLNQLIELSK